MSNAVHLTAVGAGRGEWRTPLDVFDRLNRIWQFDYDAFASHENALCKTYSTIEGTFRREGFNLPSWTPGWDQIDSLDGLRQDWDRRRVYMNPPYGRGILEEAMRKAASEANNAAVIVALVPANTDTRWWHEYVKPYATTYLLRGRIKFIDPDTGEAGGSPPGGSAIVVYLPGWLR
jgi:hypothetical protein